MPPVNRSLAIIGFAALFISFAFALVTCETLVFTPLCGLLALAIPCLTFLHRKEYKHYPICLFVFSMLIYLAVVVIIKNPLFDDFQYQHESALAFLDGDTNAYHIEVYNQWVGQVGWSLTQVPFLAIWRSTLCIKILECLCTAGCALFVYYIVAQLQTKRIAQCMSFIFVVFPTPLFMVGQLCNQPPSALLCLAAIYLFTKENPRFLHNSYARISVAGIFIALANFIRPDAVLCAISIAIAAIFAVWFGNGTTLRRRLLHSGLHIASFVGVSCLISFALVSSGVVLQDASSDNLMKIAFGTYDRGRHSEEVVDRVQEIVNAGSDYSDAEVEVIKENLSSGSALAQTAVLKTRALWWDSAHWFTLHRQAENNPDLYRFIVRIDKCFVVLLLLLCLMSVFLKVRNGSMRNRDVVIYIAVLSILAAHVIIEVQARYLYFCYMLMMIMAGPALEALFKPNFPNPLHSFASDK